MSVGIDMVKIDRFKDDFDKLKYKILSKEELEILSKKENKLEYLASRFCVKEAFLKANGVGLFDIPFNEINVLNEKNGKPYILYKDTKYENVSLSHEKEYAIAIVIL